jgi:type II secretory pathway pseudopilin PulG
MNMNPNRLALSLLEVVISISLFSVVMVAVLQSLVSTTNYVSFDTTRNDQTTTAMQCQNKVINDFANAAWFYLYDPKYTRLWRDPTSNARKVLYPSVSASGSQIEFLKLRTSVTVDPVPAKEHYGYINFNNASTKPVDLSKYMDSVPTPLMIMNSQYVADPQLFVAAVWEAPVTGLTFDQNQDAGYLRHYLYLLENNSAGIPCLVRKYYNAYGGVIPAPISWTLDEVLATGVAEVQFATWLQEPTLNENQIRITIVLRQDPSGPTEGKAPSIDRRVEIVASMRSINQDS